MENFLIRRLQYRTLSIRKLTLIILSVADPQLMLKNVPLWPRERTDWAIDPAPKRIRMKVPE